MPALSAMFPWLQRKIREARREIDAEVYARYCLVFAILLTIAVAIALYFIFDRFAIPIIYLPVLIVIVFAFSFFLAIAQPIVWASARRRALDRDTLFAGRHIWISLKGGLPLFDALASVAKGGYGEVSEEVARIVERVVVGVPVDAATSEVIEECPSPAFRRMMLQIVNAMRSGADIGDALEVILDQISREQLIAVREYGQRLNPIAMFYLLLGVIIPSIAISVAFIIASVLGVTISAETMWALAPLVVLIQYAFLAYVDTTRPTYEV